MKKMFVTVAALAALSSFGFAHAAGNAAAGKEKSGTCAGCHGPDGNSVAPNFPKLAGQHEGYLIKQLKDFRSGLRSNPSMSPQAANLSDQDIADLAAYYASQTVQGGTADKELVEAGRKIYRGGNPSTNVAACIACHGPHGDGNPAANFPKLSGQHTQYLVATLKGFREAGRTDQTDMEPKDVPGRANDAGKMMQNIAARMSDDEIEAVASYIEGLR